MIETIVKAVNILLSEVDERERQFIAKGKDIETLLYPSFNALLVKELGKDIENLHKIGSGRVCYHAKETVDCLVAKDNIMTLF